MEEGFWLHAGFLVKVSVFRMMKSESEMISSVISPRWSVAFEYHVVECALKSPVRTEFCREVKCCRNNC